MRIAASLLALLVALFAAAPTASAAQSGDPKVVLIVGPAGEATQRYRERAEAAARIAERYTSNVVRLYSPNATWPAVRQALEGAAVVVYLGHGNGWPSRYRDSLYGVTQNGFGLNPVAGGDDYTHQYFGEDIIAAEVGLARNAIVLLHHLCYASGNTEPGLPEGTIDQARERVVNYAAGFIRAGAGAVVAEGHMGPAWYVEQVFNGSRSIDRIWNASPSRHGHEFRFESRRSPGFSVAMDPDHPDRGFYRSIVYRGGVGAGSLEGAPAGDLGDPLEAPEATLVGSGVTIGTPYLRTPPVAGEETRIRFRYAAEQADVLHGLTVGVRWDPIEVTEDEDSAAEEGAEPETTESAEAAATEPVEAEVAAPDAEHGAAQAPPGLVPPAAPEPADAALAWIQPERIGDVVEPVPAIVRPTRVGIDLTLPERPGRYRLVLTLHDDAGVAYDAATQALVPGVIVDVAGPIAARFDAPAAMNVNTGEAFELEISLGNVGARAWGQVGAAERRSLEERPISATLGAHWVALDQGGATPAPTFVRLAAGLAAGTAEAAVLRLTAPTEPGAYLLLLDVVVPGFGSLAARGAEPTLVRVTVE